MGRVDLYPFVLPSWVLEKMVFVHELLSVDESITKRYRTSLSTTRS